LYIACAKPLPLGLWLFWKQHRSNLAKLPSGDIPWPPIHHSQVTLATHPFLSFLCHFACLIVVSLKLFCAPPYLLSFSQHSDHLLSVCCGHMSDQRGKGIRTVDIQPSTHHRNPQKGQQCAGMSNSPQSLRVFEFTNEGRFGKWLLEAMGLFLCIDPCSLILVFFAHLCFIHSFGGLHLLEPNQSQILVTERQRSLHPYHHLLGRRRVLDLGHTIVSWALCTA